MMHKGKALKYNHIRMGEQPVLVVDTEAVLDRDGLAFQFPLDELLSMVDEAKAGGSDIKFIIIWCREVKLQTSSIRLLG